MRHVTMMVLIIMTTVLLSVPPTVQAQANYPDRPITLIPPYPPGGLADITARALAAASENSLGGSFVITPTPGGGAIIGSTKVAQSPPDGYTLLLTPNSIPTLRPLLRKNLKFNKDSFEPIAFIAELAITLSVSKDSRWQTLQELVDEAKKNPSKLTVAVTSKGGLLHALLMLFQQDAGIQLQIVPFDGGPPATAAVLGGHVDMVFNDNPNPGFRTLATSKPTRSSFYPDTPTFVELGYKNVNLSNMYAIVAPKETPEPILRKLEAAFKEGTTHSDYKELLAKQNIAAIFIGRDETKKIMDKEYALFKNLVDSGMLTE